MENRMGQFGGGSFFSPDGTATAMQMGPFGPFGGAFMVQQVPVVPGPVAYYPPTSEQQRRMMKAAPYWPRMAEMNSYGGW